MPEDLDYYDGLLGQQPGADKAAVGGKGEPVSTSDYPIPLPSYLLLALATVVSIAFTGSIFEVTGGHPEVRALLSGAIERPYCTWTAVVSRRISFFAPCNTKFVKRAGSSSVGTHKLHVQVDILHVKSSVDMVHTYVDLRTYALSCLVHFAADPTQERTIYL